MNILVSYRGIPQSPGWATGDALCAALASLGHEVTPFGRYYSKAPASDTNSNTEETIRRLGYPLAAVPLETPDLHIWMECNDEDPQYGETLGINCPHVYWGFDDTMHWPFTAKLLSSGAFKHAFFANQRVAKAVPGSHWLPYAADTRWLTPGEHDRAGAATIGHGFAERVAFCEAAGIELFQAYREEYVTRLQQLKIHVHHHESGGPGLVVMRPFETMACGALLFAPRGLLDGLGFHAGIHYVAYTNADDCRKKIERFLADDAARESITRTALHCILENHTYRQRAEAILEVVRS